MCSLTRAAQPWATATGARSSAIRSSPSHSRSSAASLHHDQHSSSLMRLRVNCHGEALAENRQPPLAAGWGIFDWRNGEFSVGIDNQPRLLLPVRTPPVIQRQHPNAVLGAIFAPRHPAFRKSSYDSANLFLVPHPAIVYGVLPREQDGFLRRLRRIEDRPYHRTITPARQQKKKPGHLATTGAFI
jgi:hypothetical protein